MWYFSLSPDLAARAVAALAGRARFFAWRKGCLFVLPEKDAEEALRKRLAALGIFPQAES